MKNIFLKSLISASTIAMALSSVTPLLALEPDNKELPAVDVKQEEVKDKADKPQQETEQHKMEIKDFFSSKDNIETDRLIIRKMTAEDSLVMADYLLKPEMTQYLTDINYKFTKKEQPLRYILGRDEKGECLYNSPYSQRYAILLKGENNEKTVIGNIVVSEDLAFFVPSITIGYAISDKYQKNGYCQEAVDKMIKEMIKDTYLVRVNFFCMSKNQASLKVISKAGATENKQNRYKIKTKISKFNKDSYLVKTIYDNMRGKRFLISSRVLPKEILNYDLSDLKDEKTFSSEDITLTYHSYYNFDNLNKLIEAESKTQGNK